MLVLNFRKKNGLNVSNNVLWLYNILWWSSGKLIFKLQGNERRVYIKLYDVLICSIKKKKKQWYLSFLISKIKTQNWVREEAGWGYEISRIKIYTDDVFQHIPEKESPGYSRFRF